MDGAEVDYVEGLHGAGFKFNNPNVDRHLRLRQFVQRLSHQTGGAHIAERGGRQYGGCSTGFSITDPTPRT